jgi:hypothetical protein
VDLDTTRELQLDHTHWYILSIYRKTWKDLEKKALDRRAWKDVVVDLCLQGPKGKEEEDEDK